MGTLSVALQNLAAVSLPGVTRIPLEATPGALARVALPALVIVPELSGESPGLEPNPFAAGAGRLTVQVAHALLLAPLAGGAGLGAALSSLTALLDAYVAALAADPTLGGALVVPLRLRLRTGVVAYGGVDYHGAVFTHTWTLQVES
ncbi:MAG: hypothetical protein ACUVSU_12515 [Aggregatilineaceae bacterium]